RSRSWRFRNSLVRGSPDAAAPHSIPLGEALRFRDAARAAIARFAREQRVRHLLDLQPYLRRRRWYDQRYADHDRGKAASVAQHVRVLAHVHHAQVWPHESKVRGVGFTALESPLHRHPMTCAVAREDQLQEVVDPSDAVDAVDTADRCGRPDAVAGGQPLPGDDVVEGLLDISQHGHLDPLRAVARRHGSFHYNERPGGAMKKLSIVVALVFGVMVGYAGRAWTQTDSKLPMAGFNAAKHFAGAKELPDPGTDYKVVFSVAANAKDNEVHPTLKTIALYLNTLADQGVPANHRHIAA